MFSKHPPFLWNKPSHLICNLSVFYYFYAINKTVTTMIYRFTIISDEVDDFVREIQIDPEATFFDLHEAILKAANYTNDQMTSFFICDDDWEKEKEITCTTTLIQALLNNTNSLFFCCILNQYTFYFHNHHFPSLFQLHYK